MEFSRDMGLFGLAPPTMSGTRGTTRSPLLGCRSHAADVAVVRRNRRQSRTLDASTKIAALAAAAPAATSIQEDRVRRIAGRVVARRRVSLGRDVEAVKCVVVGGIRYDELVRTGVEIEHQGIEVLRLLVDWIPPQHFARRDAP